jgi:hypothetical protein
MRIGRIGWATVLALAGAAPWLTAAMMRIKRNGYFTIAIAAFVLPIGGSLITTPVKASDSY